MHIIGTAISGDLVEVLYLVGGEFYLGTRSRKRYDELALMGEEHSYDKHPDSFKALTVPEVVAWASGNKISLSSRTSPATPQTATADEPPVG